MHRDPRRRAALQARDDVAPPDGARAPETGRQALFLNDQFTRRIVEMSRVESEVLLAFLKQWSTQERFTVRCRWTSGTVAMWDNRVTQNFVVNDFEGERFIQRVTVVGDTPTGDPPRWEPHTPTRRGAAIRYDTALTRALQTIATFDG